MAICVIINAHNAVGDFGSIVFVETTHLWHAARSSLYCDRCLPATDTHNLSPDQFLTIKNEEGCAFGLAVERPQKRRLCGSGFNSKHVFVCARDLVVIVNSSKERTPEHHAILVKALLNFS